MNKANEYTRPDMQMKIKILSFPPECSRKIFAFLQSFLFENRFFWLLPAVAGSRARCIYKKLLTLSTGFPTPEFISDGKAK